MKKLVQEMFDRLLNKKNIKSPKNGKWKEFNKQAVLVAEGSYQHDLKHGLWKQYYETGEPLIEETYDNGELHGRYASFHLSGGLLSQGNYSHGKREGYFYVYDEEGNQTRSLLFVNNVLVEEADTSKLPKPARVAV